MTAPAPLHTPAGVAAAAVYAGTTATPPDTVPVPSSRVPVEFAAPESGVAELTWGQMEIWLAMTRQGWLRFGGVIPLAPGTTVADMADELHYLMTRYPSFRLRLRFDENGRPMQEVFASGQVTLDVYDVDDERDEAFDETVAAVYDHYQTAPRDFVHEWPIRMGVACRHGEPLRLIVQTCHLVSDNAGVEVFAREAVAREAAPVTGMNILELSRWQHSAAGQRHQAAVERHWRKVLGSLPPQPEPADADPRVPRHWTGQLDSPALYLAVPLIAERTRVDASTVFLALYAIALGRTGVLNPAVVRPVVSNRFRPGVRQIVTNLVQSSILVVDLANTTVDEAVLRTKRAALTAYKHAYYDAEKIEALLTQTAQERGPHLGLRTFFNDRRAGRRFKPAAQPVTARRLREAADAGAFHWFEKKDNPFETLFLHVEEASEAIVLQVCADTDRVTPARIEALARTIEAVAVEAALDPDAAGGVPAAGVPATAGGTR